MKKKIFASFHFLSNYCFPLFCVLHSLTSCCIFLELLHKSLFKLLFLPFFFCNSERHILKPVVVIHILNIIPISSSLTLHYHHLFSSQNQLKTYKLISKPLKDLELFLMEKKMPQPNNIALRTPNDRGASGTLHIVDLEHFLMEKKMSQLNNIALRTPKRQRCIMDSTHCLLVRLLIEAPLRLRVKFMVAQHLRHVNLKDSTLKILEIPFKNSMMAEKALNFVKLVILSRLDIFSQILLFIFSLLFFYIN